MSSLLLSAVSPFSGLGRGEADSDAREPASPRSAAAGDTAGEATDDRLIDRTLSGDTSAYGELVGRYQDRLRASLTRMTGSAEEAEDVAQEAFVQAYLKLSSFQRSARFYTWIYRIAFNQAVSKSRKKRPKVSLSVVQEAGGVEPVAEGDSPTHGAHLDERARLLHAAIEELAEDHRQVLVLREFEDMDYQQIAEVIDAPIGTVRSRLFRARAQLRERLEGVLGEEGEGSGGC
ncbi:sigma-70 family RNA polymerase sigma factor [Botrimarina sp.]|uniref:sigma-70 family RNA polymerase sigma factor n=1 Tax=Botrimarina sp. TaxID=2795802 RepID=UPI0032ED70F7